MTEWEEIETAPTGEDVWLLVGVHQCVGYFEEYDQEGWHVQSCSNNGTRWTWVKLSFMPSKWMPKPSIDK